MGWEVEEDGLKALFSQSIPTLVANDFTTILHAFLAPQRSEAHRHRRFACHPGGAKVLDALEDAFQIERGALTESRSILRDYGNMSAVTALFVLEADGLAKKGPAHPDDGARPRLLLPCCSSSKADARGCLYHHRPRGAAAAGGARLCRAQYRGAQGTRCRGDRPRPLSPDRAPACGVAGRGRRDAAEGHAHQLAPGRGLRRCCRACASGCWRRSGPIGRRASSR